MVRRPAEARTGKAYVIDVGDDGKPNISPAPEWLEVPAVRKDKPSAKGILINGVYVVPVVVPVRFGWPVVRGDSSQAGFALLVGITGMSETRKTEYVRWMKATCRDDLNNSYKQVLFEAMPATSELKGERTRIDGKTVSDVLAFERPVERAKELFITLPGENLGLPIPIKLKVSRAAIEEADRAILKLSGLPDETLHS